jgi:hypothetical protein
MFIVPFICKVFNQNNMTIYSIHVLTIGGNQLWEEEDHLRTKEDVLEPNDIYGKGDIQVVDTLRLCEVDTERTQIADFYKWKELPAHDQETFCWRDFYYFAGQKQNQTDSWLDTPSKEHLGSVSVARIVHAIIQTATCII